MGSEKAYETKIKNYLKSRGIYYFKMYGCAATKAGVPDLICCINGRFVGIEVKAEKGRVSPLQKINIEQIQSCGGIALVSYPDEFGSLTEIIEGILNERID